jgi:predicted MFS family arabinose efflux permease
MARAIVSPAASTARKSIIPDIAGPARISLERANSIHEAVFATGFAIGPAVGAAFIALIGPYDVFIVVAMFSALSSISALLINTVEHRGDGISETGSLLRDTALGIKTISQTPAVLLGMSFVLTLSMIFGHQLNTMQIMVLLSGFKATVAFTQMTRTLSMPCAQYARSNYTSFHARDL